MKVIYYEDGNIFSAEFEAPRNALNIGKAERKSRVLTEEQRQAARDRLAEIRKRKENDKEA